MGSILLRLALVVLLTLPGQYRVIRVEKQETATMANHRWISTDGDFGAAGSWASGVAPAVAATGTLTLTGNTLDTLTVTLDTKTYTFQATLTDVDGNVLVGTDASDSLDNLIAAITLGAGSGTKYAASMTLHPTVTAIAGAGDTMDVTAKTKGTSGNSIATTETLGGEGSFGGATLSNGTLWVTGADVAFFDDSVVTSVTSGTDLSANSDDVGFDLVTTPEYVGKIGSSGNELRNYKNTAGRMTIRGLGSVFLSPDAVSVDKYIVDSANRLDALTVNSGIVLGIYVKRGKALLTGSISFNIPDGEVFVAGPLAVLTITATNDPPERYLCEAGLLESNMPTNGAISAGTIICTGGTIDFTGTIESDIDIHVLGGTMKYRPPSDVSAKAPNAFVFGTGILDLSKSRFDVNFGELVVGPTGQVLGEVFVAGGETFDIDLREDYP